MDNSQVAKDTLFCFLTSPKYGEKEVYLYGRIAVIPFRYGVVTIRFDTRQQAAVFMQAVS